MPFPLRPFVFAALLLSASIVHAQDGRPPAPEAVPAAAPVIGSNHFHSDVLHLSFDVPADIVVRTDLSEKVSGDLAKGHKSPAGAPCISLPVLAFHPTQVRRVYFYQIELACYPDGLPQDRVRAVAAGMLNNALKTMGKPTIASPIDYDMGKQPAVVASGTVYSEKNHGIIYGEIGCTVLKDAMVCWLFNASNPEKVARLAEMPVTFDGQPAAPVIPADASAIAVPSTTTYHDDARHFTFTYPGTFADAEQRTTAIISKKVDEAADKQKAILGCMKTPLTGDELSDTTHSTIVIFNINAECQKIGVNKTYLGNIAKGIASGVAKTVKEAHMEQPVTYTLAGHDAVIVQGSITAANGTKGSILEACAIVNNDYLCWQFFSTSSDRLRQIIASKVAFDGQLPTAVVPAALLKTP